MDMVFQQIVGLMPMPIVWSGGLKYARLGLRDRVFTGRRWSVGFFDLGEDDEADLVC
jgi:hypothetical protein